MSALLELADTAWRCKRCGEDVDYDAMRCGCDIGPSPWEPKPTASPTPDIDAALAGLGQRIAARRKVLDLSLDEVAKRSGMTKSHVWELEQGRSRNPTIRMAWKLAYALGWTLSELIGVWEHTDPLDPEAMKIAVQVDAALRSRATMSPHKDELRSECWGMVEKLRSVEADSVTILCDNPDGPPNNAVICNGGWTDYQDRRFERETIHDALTAAVAAYEQPAGSEQ